MAIMTTVVWPHRANPFLGMNTLSSRSTSMKRTRTLRIVMAGGGTGGHLYPGLAVADALRARVAEMDVELELLWAATPRSVDQRLLSKFGEHYVQQPVQPLVKSVKKVVGFFKAWRQTCDLWARRFSTEKVDCVVALGGYAAGPAAYVAAKRRIPVVLLNPDALAGPANRFLLKRLDDDRDPVASGGEVSQQIEGHGEAAGLSDSRRAGGESAEPGRSGRQVSA